MHNLLWTNSNPRPENICDQCDPFIGMVFTPGYELPLPAHPGCYCTYFPTDAPANAQVHWDTMGAATRDAWIRYVAYHLRETPLWDCPYILRPLIPYAQALNRRKEPQ